MSAESPRVLCVTSHGDTLNSIRPEAEIFVGCQKAGIDVEMLVEADSLYRPRLEEHGIAVHDTFIERKFDRHAVQRLQALVRERRIDILHLFNNKAIVTGIRAARGLPVKVVTYRGQTGNLSRWDPTSYLTHLNSRVDCITCVSDAVRRDLSQHLTDPHKAITLYKGHDLDWYTETPADLSEFGLSSTDFVVGAVANLRPRKGLKYLVEAARYLPEEAPIKLLLVGNGTDSDAVREATRTHADRFALAGFRRDATALIAACDASVLAATKREGLPKTVVESMAYGVTPIATATGGSPELIEDGVSGLVIEPANARAIADAIVTLWSDEVRNRDMGRRARDRLETHFHHNATVAEHVALYRRLMRGDSPRGEV
ncbi:MAG: glycosyltransferase family 4 protein [Pseudomonadota bacterium]